MAKHKITKRSSWMDLRDVLLAGDEFTNNGGSFTGAPVGPSVRPLTGRMSTDEAAQFRADRPTYVIWSYATPIAWRRADGTWHASDARYSVTTSHHQGRAATAVSQLQYV